VLTRDAREVYSKTLAVSLIFFLVIGSIQHLLQHRIHDRVFRWATAFALVQIIAIVSLSLGLLASRAWASMKKSIDDQLRPAIRDRVMALAFEGESWSSSVPERGPARRVLEESVAHALVTLKPPRRDRIAQFAVEWKFAAQWTEEFASSRSKSVRRRAISLLGPLSPIVGKTALSAALHDEDPIVRSEASRALLIQNDHAGVENVFRSLLSESLLVRALLASELKRHTRFWLNHTIPVLLEEGNRLEVERCLEMLIAWKRALPTFDVLPWLSRDRDRSLWPLLFALLPYVAVDDWIEDYLISALASNHVPLQCEAAKAAGRLRLERLIPALSATLHQDRQLGLASATAIAQMGEHGERHLEKIAAGSDRRAAAVAMEALEHITVRV